MISHGEGTKRQKHPILGDIELEYSGFAVDGRPDLYLVIYNPVDPGVAEHIRLLIRRRTRTLLLRRCLSSPYLRNRRASPNLWP